MDFSLHSFILVIGLMVIAFIVYDGIKKVREAKANQLDQDLDLLSESDSLMAESEDFSHLDELEIADDLVSDAFANKQDSAVEESRISKTEFQIPSEDFVAPIEEPIEIESTVQEEPVEEVALAESVEEELVEEPVTAVTEESENIFQVEPEAEEVLESFSVNDEVEVEIVEEAEVIKKSQKPSKAEMLAKALEAERQARADQAEAEEHVESEAVEVAETEPVPVLMEPVELGKQVDPNPPVQQELHLPEFVQQTLQEEPEEIITADVDEPEIEAFEFEDGDTVVEQPKAAQQEKVGERLADRPAAQEIFVINVIKEGEPLLQGAELNHIFKVCDMRFGEMDIFHRFEQANAQGKIQFSVVNAVAPGKFDLDTIESIETPGISLFMSLPGPENPMEAFDAMAEVALVFSRNFNANLYDESHSDLTPQTLEHYRHRIREYSRKQVVKK